MTDEPASVAPAWVARQRRLQALADARLFFIGGAPRSGTTWVQQMLDAHPQVCCRGEGLFLHQLAVPLERLMADRAAAIEGKNRTLFTHTVGFAPPLPDDVEHLIGTGILLALDRLGADPECRAWGEKTPENVFFFPRLMRLFPTARFIGIARDPRDVLSSAWHYFGRQGDQGLEAFVAAALPSMQAGTRAMIAFEAAHPACCRLVTYEKLRTDPAPVLADLFRLIGAESSPGLIHDILCCTDFAVATGGRPAGTAQDGSFFRKGIVGDWRNTLNPALNASILEALGWSFARFDWAP